MLVQNTSLTDWVLHHLKPLRLSGGLLTVPGIQSKHGEAAISDSAPQSSNTCPEDRKLAQTLTAFKSSLKPF